MPIGGEATKSAELWRKPEYSPHISIPPDQWRVLNTGFHVLKTPRAGLAGHYNGLFHNSAGVAFDPQPGVIWTIEEYAEKKEVYTRLNRNFNPGLIAGSPAEESFRVSTMTKVSLGDAEVFSDLLCGQQVKRNADPQLRRAYNSLVLSCQEIGGDRNQILLKLRARVCRFHDLDVSDVSALRLHDFVELLEQCDEGHTTAVADRPKEAEKHTPKDEFRVASSKLPRTKNENKDKNENRDRSR